MTSSHKTSPRVQARRTALLGVSLSIMGFAWLLSSSVIQWTQGATFNGSSIIGWALLAAGVFFIARSHGIRR